MSGSRQSSRTPTGRGRRWQILTPPIDRPGLSRGPRAWLAYGTVLAAVFALQDSSFVPDPDWTDPVMKAAGAALVVASVLLWSARRPLAIAFAGALVPVAVAACVVSLGARGNAEHEESKWGGSVVTFSDHGRTRPVSPVEVASVGDGATRAQIERLLGPPIGHGIQRVVDAKDMRCLAYPNDRRDPTRGGHLHAFCFRGEHLAAQRDW